MKTLFITAIRLYQRLSPLKHQFLTAFFGFSSRCHQNPSCSEYTIFQIQKHGTITGLKRGFIRAAHCVALPNKET